MKFWSIYLLLLLNLGQLLQAQVYFNKRFDYNNSWIEESQCILNDSGYFYSAISTLFLNGPGYWITPGFLKLDSSGNVIDIYLYGFHFANAAVGTFGLTKIMDGFLITGQYHDSLNNDIFLIKTRYNGDSIWSRRYSGSPYQDGWQTKETQDGNYMLCGSKENAGSPEMLLMKLDTAGNIIWERMYGSPTNGECALSFTNTSDGGYALLGFSSIPGPNFNIYLVKTDSLGIMQWNTIIGTPQDEEGSCVISTQDGNIVIAGFLSNGTNGQFNAYIAKFDLQGNLLWQNTYLDATGQPKIFSIKELPDGSLIAAGRIFGSPSGILGFILKTNSVGDSLWCFDYYNSLGGNNELYDIAEDSNGGFVACGSMSPHLPDTGNQDCWFLRVDSNGCEVNNCILSVNPILSEDKNIIVYPNPFSNELRIKTDEAGNLNIIIYNAFGIERLNIPSKYPISVINTSSFSQGIYFISIQRNNRREIYKIIKE